MSGDSELDAILAKIASIPNLGVAAAPDVAIACERVTRNSIAAGTDPDGRPWAPRKKDGAKPLTHADKALTVGSTGALVILTLRGPEALHHLGRAKGGTKRAIIPTDDIPQPMAAAIEDALTRAFAEAMSK
jgi:hypothetical protein